MCKRIWIGRAALVRRYLATVYVAEGLAGCWAGFRRGSGSAVGAGGWGACSACPRGCERDKAVVSRRGERSMASLRKLRRPSSRPRSGGRWSGGGRHGGACKSAWRRDALRADIRRGGQNRTTDHPTLQDAGRAPALNIDEKPPTRLRLINLGSYCFGVECTGPRKSTELDASVAPLAPALIDPCRLSDQVYKLYAFGWVEAPGITCC